LSSNKVSLKLLGIVKQFPGVLALNSVSLEAHGGEIHALVGENGSGKSTLMAIASGALAPDAGTIEISGESLLNASPDRARELGLAIVRQDPALLPHLTVAENMAIGVGLHRVGGLKKAVAWAQEQVDPWEVGINARSRVADLTQEQRYIVEISKAFFLNPKVLILDEPTENLSLVRVQKLFEKIREQVANSVAVIYISHRIPEVKEIADVITVLRDGTVEGTYPANEIDENQIIEKIIGRSLDAIFPTKLDFGRLATATEQLIVTDLHGESFTNLNFIVRAGEILGIAGVQGNGQTELIRTLAGLNRAKGEVLVNGKKVKIGNAVSMAKSGVFYVPADRHGEGVLLSLGVAENIVARHLPQVSKAGVIQQSKITEVATTQIERLSIKTPSHKTTLASLSGGNQQKVVLSRMLLMNPKVILAEEPTQGVDAGARVDIYAILREAANNGAAIIVMSSNSVELEWLCDRVLIMSRGTVVDEISAENVTEAAITTAALTSTTVKERIERVVSTRNAFRNWLRGDQSPAVVLLTIFVLLGLVVSLKDSLFISSFNINTILFSAAPLIFVGIAQQIVVMGSGFDLSVGPLTGFLAVISSYFCINNGNPVLGFALMILAALAVGVINGGLITKLNIDPIVMTLVSFMGLQGLFLLMRPTPGGAIADAITAFIAKSVGPVPLVTVIAILSCFFLEWVLRRTKLGVELRAVGSRRDAAEKLGINASRLIALSYLLSALFCFPAALVLMSIIGIGDGRPGVGYTLSSVTVVVLAGASIFGGRGSFIGIAMAGILIQQVLSAAPFLGLAQDWTYWLSGGITVIAAVIFAQIRGSGKRS
jgi:ribose transport system ATP-binding protein